MGDGKGSSELGRKDDQGKERFDLIDPGALRSLAKVLTHGANKYGDNNWAKVDRAQARYFAAAQRHLWAWKSGERLDPETKLPHLAHASACLMFLLAFEGER